jgi:hypothetical protein
MGRTYTPPHPLVLLKNIKGHDHVTLNRQETFHTLCKTLVYTTQILLNHAKSFLKYRRSSMGGKGALVLKSMLPMCGWGSEDLSALCGAQIVCTDFLKISIY